MIYVIRLVARKQRRTAISLMYSWALWIIALQAGRDFLFVEWLHAMPLADISGISRDNWDIITSIQKGFPCPEQAISHFKSISIIRATSWQQILLRLVGSGCYFARVVKEGGPFYQYQAICACHCPSFGNIGSNAAAPLRIKASFPPVHDKYFIPDFNPFFPDTSYHTFILL